MLPWSVRAQCTKVVLCRPSLDLNIYPRSRSKNNHHCGVQKTLPMGSSPSLVSDFFLALPPSRGNSKCVQIAVLPEPCWFLSSLIEFDGRRCVVFESTTTAT